MRYKSKIGKGRQIGLREKSELSSFPSHIHPFVLSLETIRVVDSTLYIHLLVRYPRVVHYLRASINRPLRWHIAQKLLSLFIHVTFHKRP
jgi:hypothetical protein